MSHQYDLLLLDAANTIIHKPKIWKAFQLVLGTHGYVIDVYHLKQKHKLLSEAIHFPDRTDASFYENFNREVLLALGIIPTKELLEDIFKACTYLPWESFEDVKVLKELTVPIVVLSNFKNTLKSELEQLYGSIFMQVITSEEIGFGKPKREFYLKALEITGVPANRILYIGDSLKLDIIPAQSVGMNTLLIDRDKVFEYHAEKIESFKDLKKIIS